MSVAYKICYFFVFALLALGAGYAFEHESLTSSIRTGQEHSVLASYAAGLIFTFVSPFTIGAKVLLQSTFNIR
jgi:hypothetical protein